MVDTVGSFTNVASVSIIIFVVSFGGHFRVVLISIVVSILVVIVIRVHALLVIVAHGLGGAKRTLASVIGASVIIANRWVVEWTCTRWRRTTSANILAISHRV
jgi:hypothetical protein